MTPSPSPAPLSSARLWKPLLALGVLGGAVWLVRARQNELKALVVGGVLETPRRSYAELRRDLDRAGTRLSERLARAADSEANRELARHIIGIERWGHSRLRVLSGEREFVDDTYRPYRPADELGLSELRDLFSLTRAQTSELARSFEVTPPVREQVLHNMIGPISARAWLRYLSGHADWESRKLKSA
ncbi:DinB family protein [Deinococcus sp.]|uniref:DinB family protein n=1 Tax=Deinococcus sp. TaxID=47478 RepID=UPI0025FE35F5|nr:DinB family protein [Deinococcus sp.]